MPEINPQQVRATAEYLARLVGCVVVGQAFYADVARLRRLVGDEDVDAQWRGFSRSDVIALAEEHYAEAERLRIEKAAMWELLKSAVRTYRENDEIAMDELGHMEREHDRLRQELDLIAGQPQGNNPYWQLRSKRVEAERDVMAEALVAVQHVIRATETRLSEKPAEPRRWGRRRSPEPEIGTTVRRTTIADYYQNWTRTPDGWHPNHDCRHGHADQCSGLMFRTWNQLPRPLVEVVDTDG